MNNRLGGIVFLIGLALGVLRGTAAEPTARAITISAGEAVVTLKQLSAQSGAEVVFATSAAKNVTTNAVQGRYSALQAATSMLTGTGLAAAQDEKTGAIVIARRLAVPAEAASAGRVEREVVQLNPFEVSAGRDNSYGALNSNSITSFTTELNKLPVSADIFDQTFMNDLGVMSVEEMVQGFAAGAAVSSSSPATSASTQQQYDRNGSALSLRGLAATSILRNGFYPAALTGVGYTTNFDLQQVEVISGPQSLLYGAGGGGGVVNYISKQAKFNSSLSGEVKFQVDQYGKKMGTADFNLGGKQLAVRMAFINQQVGGRRLFIGGPLVGGYVQVAARPVRNTTVRVEYEKTSWSRISNTDNTLTALSTANDARNGQSLHYLLATNQIAAAANGAPSGAGVIANGKIDWENVDSFGSAMIGELTRSQFVTAQIETVWTPWLSTRIAGGYTTRYNKKLGNGGVDFLAPNAAGNPLGGWAMDFKSSVTTSSALWGGSQAKNLRVSALLSNDLFGGRAKSQTVFGGDFTGSAAASSGLYYVAADANFNPVNTGQATNNGFSNIPVVYWPVANGPSKYPLIGYDGSKITIAGKNYVQVPTNAPVAGLVSPSNPLGLTGNSTGSWRPTHGNQKGVYLANFTNWLDGRLTTLVGARLSSVYTLLSTENNSRTQPSLNSISQETGKDFSAGANFRLLSWLRPYVQFSDSFSPPAALNRDPYGAAQNPSKAVGTEAGIKVTNQDGTLSGSVGVYRTNAQNEQTSFSVNITGFINPVGLNGRLGGSPSNWINVDRKSEGLQATFTANPQPNWRMRVSGSWQHATNQSNNSFAQVYNDQFYANNLGQVTYKDGAVVYVSSTGTRATVSTAGTVGAVPLTLTMMGTPGNLYYANQGAVHGAINASSGAATILNALSDPQVAQHGPILTGAVGLPIAQMQIKPSFTPVGTIPIMTSGDQVQGYPQIAVNYESVYTFDRGPLKGLRAGGAFQGMWKYSAFYYYPVGLSNNPTNRALYAWPTRTLFTGIFGYDWAYRRYRISHQLNVNNVFNHYHIVIIPNYINGWAGPNNATFDTQPRSYVFSTRVSF